jgi:hypothetical protein
LFLLAEHLRIELVELGLAGLNGGRRTGQVRARQRHEPRMAVQLYPSTLAAVARLLPFENESKSATAWTDLRVGVHQRDDVGGFRRQLSRIGIDAMIEVAER